ncbi:MULTISPECIES: hypothetical protein [unclassified Streptomyces]|uniref:hypothetical protein n=1 Tax=unclassified Streptomyces TaxID=2593676 RepID=UPI00278C0FCD|nr:MULTISPECIES: hypothetical protein [unclassified Streptomyces]
MPWIMPDDALVPKLFFVEPSRLPFIDEHRIVVAAPAEQVWPVLAAEFGRSSGRTFELYARYELTFTLSEQVRDRTAQPSPCGD